MKLAFLFLITTLFPFFGETQTLEQKDLSLLPKVEIKSADGKETSTGTIIKQETIGTRFIHPYYEEAHISFDKLFFFDKQGTLVTPTLDRVTVIQYWSLKGIKGDRFWEQFIKQQAEHKENEHIHFLSVFFDLSSNSKETFQKTIERLNGKSYSIPENLYFDFNDSFRSIFDVFGGNSYYVVDNRSQLILLGRGDFEETEEIFSEIPNAIKNMEKDGFEKNPRQRN